MSVDEYENGACGKSCSQMSLGEGGDLLGDGSYVVPWECQHGSWLLQTEAPAGWVSGGESRSIPAVEWDDPALAASCVAWLKDCKDLSWGEMIFLADMQRYAAETPSQRADRNQAIALRDAADNQASIVSRVALKEKKWTDHGAMKFRVPRPCRYAMLFKQRTCAHCASSVPVGQSHCSGKVVMVEEMERRRDGRMAFTGKMITRQARAGDTGVRVCGEALVGCWNHEQHRTCIYVHPDEPQWTAACSGTLRVKNDNRLIFCMAGEEGPPLATGQQQQPNRFSALAGGSAQQRGGQQRGGQQRPRIPSQREAEERDYGVDRGIYRAVMGGVAVARVAEQRQQRGSGAMEQYEAAASWDRF
jgi:predicted nucleic acid-binding Zn ribbon protein